MTFLSTKDGHTREIASCITFRLLPRNSFVMAGAEKNRTLALLSLLLSLSLSPLFSCFLSLPLPPSLSHHFPLEVHNVVLISPRLPQENSSVRVCVNSYCLLVTVHSASVFLSVLQRRAPFCVISVYMCTKNF